MKFRTAPLNVTEEAEKAAIDALCPPITLCHWERGGHIFKERLPQSPREGGESKLFIIINSFKPQLTSN